MATFIENIGGVRLNGLGADIYENANGSASIRFDKLGRNLPRKLWINFDSVKQAEEFVNRREGSNGAQTLNNVLNAAGI